MGVGVCVYNVCILYLCRVQCLHFPSAFAECPLDITCNTEKDKIRIHHCTAGKLDNLVTSALYRFRNFSWNKAMWHYCIVG